MIHQDIGYLEGDNLIQTTNAQKAEIDNLINSSDFYLTEKVWAYLMTSILVNSSNRNDYFKLFCNESISIYPNIDIWFEAEPLSVRKGSTGNTEGNISVDLAFGNIKKRGKTKVAIEYDYVETGSWVCFVEAKLFTDCRSYITCDFLKNQVVHIIENLVCFQGNGNFPEKLFFTLLTPRFFKENHESRFYGYKIKEYENIDKIIYDIKRSKIPERHQQNWNYPDNLEERVKLLKINWITFEEIFEKEYGIKNLDLTNLTQPTIERFKKLL